jgi:hypothetical protein
LAGSNAPAYQAVNDKLFQQTPPGALMSVVQATMLGAKEGWGEGQIGISDDTANHLRDIGVFDDYKNSQGAAGKEFLEAVLRPAAIAGDTIMRGFNALATSTVAGAGQAADELEGTFGVEKSSPQTNAYQAQDFVNFLYINSGFTAEGLPLGAQAQYVAGRLTKAPVPPSAVQLPTVAETKPYEADISFKPVTEEEMVAKTGELARKSDH